MMYTCCQIINEFLTENNFAEHRAKDAAVYHVEKRCMACDKNQDEYAVQIHKKSVPRIHTRAFPLFDAQRCSVQKTTFGRTERNRLGIDFVVLL